MNTLRRWQGRAQIWFGARTKREQTLLRLCAGFMALFVFFSAVWLPVSTTRDAEFARIARYDVAIARLDSLSEPTKAGVSETAAVQGTDTPLAVLVAKSAETAALPIRRLEPGQTSVSVTMDAVKFDMLVGWLDTLARENGVTAAALTLERQTAPGAVSVRLTLERGAS